MIDDGVQIIAFFFDDNLLAETKDHDKPTPFVDASSRSVRLCHVDGHPNDPTAESFQSELEPPFDVVSDGLGQEDTLPMDVDTHGIDPFQHGTVIHSRLCGLL